MSFRELSSQARLRRLIGASIAQPAEDDIRFIAAHIARRLPGVVAVIYYGSRLRDRDPSRIIDFYVLTEGAPTQLPSWKVRVVQALISPLVFTESFTDPDGGKQKAKYAVVSVKRFKAGISRRFHSYYWARFAQPCRLAFCRDIAAADAVADCIVSAIVGMVGETLAIAPNPFSTRELWTKALSSTYRCELRPERNRRSYDIYDANRSWFEAITPAILEIYARNAEIRAGVDKNGETLYSVESTPWERRLAALRWKRRRIAGKALSLLRLIAAGATFTDWRDYVTTKIFDHSGTRLELQGKSFPRSALIIAVAWFRGFAPSPTPAPSRIGKTASQPKSPNLPTRIPTRKAKTSPETR